MTRAIITPEPQGENMDPEYVTIRAQVQHSQEGVLTVRLEDGFGRAEVVVDAAAARPA